MDPVYDIAKTKRKTEGRAVAKTPDPDFIPYVCHYDPNTILTKNGELLQVIRIEGFSDKAAVLEMALLRDTLRNAIIKHVKTKNFAFWFHTLRRRKSVVPAGEYNEYFADVLNKAWIEDNSFEDYYINELYITVIIEGVDTSITNLSSFFSSFWGQSTIALHREQLKKAHKSLSELVTKIYKEVEGYGAKVLGIKDWYGVLYSEPMRFFGKIINLFEERYPLSVNDISEELASHRVAFGDREIQVSGDNNKNFAAIFSLKEYHEVSVEMLDHILQLPFEFIITQSFDYTFAQKDVEVFKYQDYILKLSQDEEMRAIIGDLKDTETESVDYGKLQTTLMLIERSQEELNNRVNELLENLTELGFITVREDLFLEHCFWGQLPGNFKFLRRQRPIAVNKFCGFAALHHFQSGNLAGNHWGNAVSVLKTVLGTPYYFNFHTGDLGHTLILGPLGSGKTVLTNFLVCQAGKFNNRLFYFDFNLGSKCFIKAMGGNYYSLKSDQDNLDLSALITAFDITEIINQPQVLIPTFSKLLSQIEEKLDGTKTIIVLNEAWELIDNPTFKVQLEDFLMRMRSKNCVVIFSAEEVDRVGNSDVTPLVLKNLSTQIYLPNPKPEKYYSEVFGLDIEELAIISEMENSDRHFLLKHDGDSIIAALNLSNHIELLKILSCDSEVIKLMEKALTANSNDPKAWVPKLIDSLGGKKKKSKKVD